MNKKISTDYLERLTDDFGVWQHATSNEIIKDEGYALDDSSRSLIVFLLYENLEKAKICLNYIETSLKKGNFVGFFDQNREPIVFPSSHDAAALTIWSLCFAISKDFESERCKEILKKIDFDQFLGTQHLRTFSYLVIAGTLFRVQSSKMYYNQILNRFNKDNWFERKITYANGVLPLALIEHYSKNYPDKEAEIIIKKSIVTLEKYMRIGVIPGPTGNREGHIIGSPTKDIYGQQPIDAGFMVILLCRAYEIFKEDVYREKAKEWIEWFYGNNIFRQSLIRGDFACCDGLDEHGPSTNYGAESTIIYLWANNIYLSL